MSKLQIDDGLCDRCGSCIDACPAEIIAMYEEKIGMTDPDSCMECQLCEVECPKMALKLMIS